MGAVANQQLLALVMEWNSVALADYARTERWEISGKSGIRILHFARPWFDAHLLSSTNDKFDCTFLKTEVTNP
jgi:hypothetical protein